MQDLTYLLCGDTYVFTMYGEGSSKCYIRISYNMSRSGDTMNYTIRVGARMGDSGSYCYIPWRLTPRYWNGSNWTTLSEKKVKNYRQDHFGTKWFYSDWSFSRNVNEINTEIQVKWRGVYDDNTGSNVWMNFRSFGSVGYIKPSAPSVPGSISIPSSIAPDKTASISWSASSGGTNGVKGYEWQWSLDGGANWKSAGTTTAISHSLNLNSNGFKHNSKLAARSRSYTTVNGATYYSGWKTSSVTTTLFVAPSAPTNLSLSFNTEEPIPTASFTGSWNAPSSGGTNGVSGYTFSWLKNGSVYTSDSDIGNVLSKLITLTENYEVGSKISFRVRAYTVGQGTKYYSGYSTSGTITIVSDKFIFVSVNGNAFDKRKMYVSIDGASFKEVKKDKFRII